MDFILNSLKQFKYQDLFPNFFKSNSTITNIACFIGLYYILKSAIGVLRWTKQYFLTFEKDFKKAYGEGWVLITGSSDGIGKQYAIEFAKRGHNILLMARSEEKLKLVSDEVIKINDKIKVKYIVFDFDRKYTDTDLNELKEKLSSYISDISILINNVGFSNRVPYSDLPYDKMNSLINVTLQAPLWMTRIILPFMQKRKSRSLIVNVGSGMGRLHLAYSALYCGGKSYLEAFSRCINQEGYNIDITHLNTGRVITNMNQGSGFGKIDVNNYARSSMCQFGNYEFSQGHAWQSFEQYLVMDSIFASFISKIYEIMRYKQMLKERKEEEEKNKLN